MHHSYFPLIYLANSNRLVYFQNSFFLNKDKLKYISLLKLNSILHADCLVPKVNPYPSSF